MGAYCKEYKSIACFFFHWLLNCLTKICLVMIRHIFVLPRDEFSALLLYKLWACNGRPMMHIIIPLSVYYMLKVYIRGPKICVWAALIFFSKRWTESKADKKQKEANNAFVFSARRTHCWFYCPPLSSAHWNVWRLHVVVTICEIVVHVHNQPIFNMGWKHSLL